MAKSKKKASAYPHSGKSFENITYREKEIREREFNDCRFYKCDLYGANFEDSVFSNCLFENCDLSLVKLKHCSFINVHILNSKAMGILWHETTNPFSVKFTETCIDYSSFYGRVLKKLQVINCQARDVDFTKCNLTEANFEGTDLAKTTFYETDITKANFVNARNYFINMYVNAVKQAKFSMPEAIALLNNFDIIIEP
jgi:fluoroquinolone resistance protein